MIISIILVTIFSTVITLTITPIIAILAKKFGLVDNPKIRMHPAHTHKGIIPRAGGVPLLIGIFLPVLVLFPLVKSTIGILLGVIVLVLVGLWDDKKDRSPYIRFITNCLAAILAISFGVGIPYITSPIGGLIHLDFWRINLDFFGPHSILVLADLFALFWIVWSTNIIGWSGGVDGQLPGFVSISALVIGILSLRFASTDVSQIQTTYLSFATAGAFLGFLPWNFYPQKIMPGYGGKTLAGFMLATLSILSYSKVGTAFLVLIIPMLDAIFIITKRIISGKSPVWASSGHLHHQLLKLGWGRRRIALFYWFISALAGFIAIFLNSQQKIYGGILIIVIIVGLIIWLNFFKNLQQSKPDSDYETF